MENVRFNTRYRTFTSSPKEEIAAPTETLPDETLSIPEILARYVRQGASNVDTSYPEVHTPDDELYNEEMGIKSAAAPADAPAAAPAAEPAAAPAAEPAAAPAAAPSAAPDSTK